MDTSFLNFLVSFFSDEKNQKSFFGLGAFAAQSIAHNQKFYIADFYSGFSQ